MEEKSCHPTPNDNGTFEVARSTRYIPPAHYTFKIESFSQLSQILLDTDVENYESDIFEASGYKWKLSLYPNGDKGRNGEGHISLYLVIAGTDDLPLGWEVNVNFKLFVFDQIRGKYMTIQDVNGKVRCFHGTKTDWGFAQLLPLRVFNDATNGYLIRDTCVFGAEVFVINYTGNGECLSLLKGLEDPYTWKIDNFSALDDKDHYSEVFTMGNCKWKLKLYPKGDSRAKGKALSLFLEYFDDWKTERKMYVEYKLCLRYPRYGTQNKEETGKSWFSASSNAWGFSKFLLLNDLSDPYMGFLVNDTLIIDAQITRMSTVKNLS